MHCIVASEHSTGDLFTPGAEIAVAVSPDGSWLATTTGVLLPSIGASPRLLTITKMLPCPPGARFVGPVSALICHHGPAPWAGAAAAIASAALDASAAMSILVTTPGLVARSRSFVIATALPWWCGVVSSRASPSWVRSAGAQRVRSLAASSWNANTSAGTGSALWRAAAGVSGASRGALLCCSLWTCAFAAGKAPFPGPETAELPPGALGSCCGGEAGRQVSTSAQVSAGGSGIVWHGDPAVHVRAS